MDKLVPTLIIVAILIVVLLAMRRSWRRREARDGGLPAGYPVPTHVNRDLASVGAWYVATTEHDSPFERLALRGLGFRGKAIVDVTDDGVTISVAGERSVYVPARAIVHVGTATSTIDRVVEPGGMIRFDWRLDPAAEHEATGAPATARIVDSYLRVVERSEHDHLMAAISEIQSGRSAHTAPESEE